MAYLSPNVVAHRTTHEVGGSDEIDVTNLSGLLADPQTPLPHAATHQVGGADEINVTGLSGILADAQPPALHAVDHEVGGADEIDVTGLSGVLADAQTPAAHAVDHEVGGADEVSIAGLAGESVEMAAHRGVESQPIHGSTVVATAEKLVHRDAAGRARIANPAVDADIDNQGSRNTAIATHAAIADAHHNRSHDHSAAGDGSPIAEAGVPNHMSKNKLAWTANRLLLGAGAAANPTEHEPVSAATAERIVIRDAASRAQVANPAVDADIDTKGARDTAIGTHAALTSGVHGAGVGTYIAKSTTDGLDMAAHAARHGFLGADEALMKSLFMTQVMPYVYKPWWDTTGFTQDKDAEATITLNNADLGNMYFQTGATANKKASVYADIGMRHKHNEAPYRIRFHGRLAFWIASMSDFVAWIGCFETPATPTATQHHVGFTIEGADVYATNAEGATQTKSASLATLSSYHVVDFFYIYGLNDIKFYLNQHGAGWSLKATHTTNRPDNDVLKPCFYIKNSAAVNKMIYVYPFAMHAGAE